MAHRKWLTSKSGLVAMTEGENVLRVHGRWKRHAGPGDGASGNPFEQFSS